MSFEIDVVFALPDQVHVQTVRAVSGDTLQAVVERSGLLDRLSPESVLTLGLGIYGELRLPSDLIHPGDRVELYRPLPTDPKAARRQRAQKKGRD